MTNTTEENKNFIQSFIAKKSTFHMNAFNLENITQVIYGKSIEMLESPNDTTHEFTVEEKQDNYKKEDLQKAIKNGYLEYWQYDCILNDLCEKGLIEPGKYFLRMSW